MSDGVRRACAAWALLVVVTAPGASAQTVLGDLVADYVPGVNAGDSVMPAASGTGHWRYLASATLNPTDPGAALADLEWDTSDKLFERPGLNHEDGFSEDALRSTASALVMHPANVLGDGVVARWIAGPGEGGTVDVVGHVAKGDPGGGDGVRFLIYVDGVSLFDELLAFDDTVGVPFALLGVPVAEGSTVDFVVSKVASPFFDTTFVTAVITAPFVATTSTTTTITTSTTESTSTTSSTSTTTVTSSTTTTSLPEAVRFPDGQKLLIKRRKAGDYRLQLIGKGPDVDTAQPCETDGLLVIQTAGGASVAFPLDATLWRAINARKPDRGCKYRHGPVVTAAKIKTGKSLAVIAAAADVGVSLESDPRPVRVELRHGSARHCFEFTPTTKGAFKADKKLLAKRAGRATGCPEPPASQRDTLAH